MAISVGGDASEPMVEPNVIPLVDIMLVLLIIFIITIPVMTHAVKIDLPRDTPNEPTEPPEVINLEIDFDGSIIWNGSVIDGATMIDFIRTDANKDPQPEVHLRANSRARYEYVAYVLFALQRNGLKKIGFLTGDPTAAPAG